MQENPHRGFTYFEDSLFFYKSRYILVLLFFMKSNRNFAYKIPNSLMQSQSSLNPFVV